MPKAKTVDPDVMLVARAIYRLRRRAGVTQRQAAEAHEPEISYQYWAMNETGSVPGVVKPATQRKLLAAINRAAGLETPLTLADLDREIAAPGAEPLDDGPDGRALRIAKALGAPGASRQAVFPTSQGDVIFTFPADMTGEGFAELGGYLDVFLKANAPKS